jgi:hypothetical protein
MNPRRPEHEMEVGNFLRPLMCPEIKVMQRENSTVFLEMFCKLRFKLCCLSIFKTFSFSHTLKTALGMYQVCRCHLLLLLNVRQWGPSSLQSPLWLSLTTFSDPSLSSSKWASPEYLTRSTTSVSVSCSCSSWSFHSCYFIIIHSFKVGVSLNKWTNFSPVFHIVSSCGLSSTVFILLHLSFTKVPAVLLVLLQSSNFTINKVF